MPRRVQDFGPYEKQFRNIVDSALDKSSYVDVTSHATPDTEFSFEHGLRYIPNGFLVIAQDKAAVTYKGATVWNTEKIYLKTNVASTALRISVF